MPVYRAHGGVAGSAAHDIREGFVGVKYVFVGAFFKIKLSMAEAGTPCASFVHCIAVICKWLLVSLSQRFGTLDLECSRPFCGNVYVCFKERD